MDSIDKLLSELKAQYQQPASQAGREEIENEKVKIKKVKLDSFPSSSSKADVIDNILAEVKQDFEQKQLLEEQQKQQELEEERIKQEQIKAKKLELLKTQAQEWLKQLEPLSPEGLWFETFAQSYPSKLEAAIEYLTVNS